MEASGVGVVSRPTLTAAQAGEAMLERWGIEGALVPLPSERDQNFLVEGERGRFVLKIANRAEDRAVLDMQNRAMERMAGAGLPCPSPLRDRDGESISHHHGHLVRLLPYLEGRPMAEVHPRSVDLLRDLGRTMGAADVALEGFDHPAASRHLYWDVRHAERTIGDRLRHIADPARRGLVRRTLDRIPRAIEVPASGLRRSVIHNDANDHNVLVDERNQRVSGLIDFGDMVRTVVANEVAVACSYAMLDEDEPIEAAKAVVGGYREAGPLHDAELAVLLDLIRLRLATSVTVSAHQHAQRPDDPYLTVSERQAWALLELLDPIEPETARRLFLDAR